MSTYSVKLPDGPERGIRVECDVHGESQEFEPGYQTVAFHCDTCGYEVEVTVHDTHDWRDFGELC